MLLTDQNYQKGMLMDDEWMAGISQHPDQDQHFIAFVIDYLEGEYLLHRLYTDLSQALQDLNAIKRSWNYEKFSGGCQGNCKVKGMCNKKAGGCGCH